MTDSSEMAKIYVVRKFGLSESVYLRNHIMKGSQDQGFDNNASLSQAVIVLQMLSNF